MNYRQWIVFCWTIHCSYTVALTTHTYPVFKKSTSWMSVVCIQYFLPVLLRYNWYCVSLRYTICLFYIFIHADYHLHIALFNTSTKSLNYLFFRKHIKSNFLATFIVIMLTVTIMLCIRSPRLIHFLTGCLFSLTNISSFPWPPSPW